MKGGRTMKKITNKVLSKTADLALEFAVASSGLASLAGTYQPKEPIGLKEWANKKSKAVGK